VAPTTGASRLMRVEIPGALDGERLDRAISFVAHLSRRDAAAAVTEGRVRLDGSVVTKVSRRVAPGAVLEVELAEPDPGPSPEPAVDVTVLYADDAVIVVDKPAGLVVHPGAGHATGTLVNALLARFPDMMGRAWPDPARPGVVHRLDKGTSGVLMVARTPEAAGVLSAQLQVHSVERRYLALVWGSVVDARGVIDAPLGRSSADPTRIAVRVDGRRAVTTYEVVGRWASPHPTTLLRCALETGRTHQIRVHLAAIGHPVVGDGRYRGAGAGRRVSVAPRLAPGRPFLHAAVLGFDHPDTGARLRFESPLPADLVGVLAGLAEPG